MNQKKAFKKPGLTLLWTDVPLLLGTLALSTYVRGHQPMLADLMLYVLGTFFLYCNVFRIFWKLEVAWAAYFCAIGVLATLTNAFSWHTAFLLGALGSVVVIGLHMRAPGYHGIFWKTINPALLDWRRKMEDADVQGLNGQ